MEALREYLLSVTAAAIICAVLGRLLPQKGTASAMGKLLMGAFLAFTVLSPWTKIRIDQLTDFTLDLGAQASQAVAQGQLQTNSALQDIIKKETQAYILDKAEALGLTLSVQVQLSQDPVPKPIAVCLEGPVSPYAKSRLQTIISQDLGIPKEQQIWK